MAQLSNKIKIYLDREINFLKDVRLQDDGQGAYIKEWNVAEVQPTEEQLDNLESQAETLENNNQVIATRKKEYGSTAKQIEFITEKGLEAWKTNVQAIKTKYPKE